MKLLFLTDNFPPETNAPATRTYEHCKIWVEKGIDVTVITGAPNFPEGKVFKGYKNKLYQKEVVDGIKVIRVWTYISANKGFIKRVLDFVSFMISAFIAGLFIKTDKIVATSPQFFTAIAGSWLSFWKRKPWVFEVRDIWPESVVAVGASKRNIAIRFFEWLEIRMYQSASKIIVVTDAFKAEILGKCTINENKIHVVKNSANLNLFNPTKKDETLVKNLKLENKLVIGYIGTFGMAHALDFILNAAKVINDDSLHFILLGTGAEKENLIKLKSDLQLDNVSILDPVPKAEISRYISILDAGLVNLKKSKTFESVIPSKMFELVAMGKPILLGVEGESEKMLKDYNLGYSFEPENQEEFIQAVNDFKSNTQEWNFKPFLAEFNRTNMATKMLEYLN